MIASDRSPGASPRPGPGGPAPRPAAASFEAVAERLAGSAYFSLFSVPNPERPDVPIPAELPFPFSLLTRLPFLSDQLLAAVEVNEAPLRFATEVHESGGRLLATNRVGREIATVHIRWTPIPWSYPANPHERPPQTILNPLVSQRFEMLDGRFRFADGSGFDGFGAGRTFPNFPRGLALKIGAVIDVLEGVGRLRGATGMVVVNGEIEPPQGLNLNLMARILDPPEGIRVHEPLGPLAERSFPDPGATFMTFLGETDPAAPLTPVRTPARAPVRGGAGAVAGIDLRERLRRVDLDFDVTPGAGVRTRSEPGEALGEVRAALRFAPGAHRPPVPVQSRDVRLALSDAAGRSLGAVEAELVEGRAFPTTLPGLPARLWRWGAFGPVRRGSGAFDGAEGMLTVNSAVCLDPPVSSTLYVLRFVDPEGRFRTRGGASAGGAAGGGTA